MNSLCAVITAWLNSLQRIRVEINRSARRSSEKRGGLVCRPHVIKSLSSNIKKLCFSYTHVFCYLAGAAYCQFMDMLFPGNKNMHLCNKKMNIHNYVLCLTSFYISSV